MDHIKINQIHKINVLYFLSCVEIEWRGAARNSSQRVYSLLFCYCDKLHDQEQLKEERVYFSLLLQRKDLEAWQAGQETS